MFTPSTENLIYIENIIYIEVLEMGFKVVWKGLPDGLHKDHIPRRYKRVRNDKWLQNATKLYSRKNSKYIFYFDPDTKETLVINVTLYLSKWHAALGIVIKNGGDEAQAKERLIEIIDEMKSLARI